MNRLPLVTGLCLLLASCTPPAPGGIPARDRSPETLRGRTWHWKKAVRPTQTLAAPSPERYTLEQSIDGRVKARFDCNGGGGRYRATSGRLTFGPMMSTRMACPGDSSDILFMRDLARVHGFLIEIGQRHLELEPDGGTMHFRPAP